MHYKCCHVYRYQYPAPSMQVLANIARALCAVPRFYTQVLHLMNRMNLPSPFHETCQEHQAALDAMLGPRTVIDPMPTEASRHEEVDMQTSSSESEMESDGETPRERSPPPRLPAKRPRRTLKRTKLITKSQGVKSTPTLPVTDVFDVPSPAGPSQHKIELKLTSTSTASSLAETPPSDSSGFGVLFPPVPETPETEQPTQEVSESDGTTITVAQLRANRLPDRDRSLLPVFKGYQSGAPSCRLYVKNISKSVTSRDLHFIFRAFLATEDDPDKCVVVANMSQKQ
ncbi:UNVERIFIED_CONTAM: hypothetical protein B566_EDAN018467 [Ephemera danica]|nr:hypothetical protein B566_EDAN018467 [Ephemera danica]